MAKARFHSDIFDSVTLDYIKDNYAFVKWFVTVTDIRR